MILVNTETISGKELEMLGLVKGSTIQSRNVGRDITQSFKTLVGGKSSCHEENGCRSGEPGSGWDRECQVCFSGSYAGSSRSYGIWNCCEV